MTETAQEISIRYLQSARDAALWKLDGLSDHDVRRPLTPTGTNLLGLVKHLACCEIGYFTQTFGRESPVPLPFDDEDADHNDDLWVPHDTTREETIAFYELSWAEAAKTFETHGLDDTGVVPWWPEERATVTLHQVLVHMTTETARHVGQMDILREGLDASIGMRPESPNLPDDTYDWPAYVAKVQAAADHHRDG